MSIRTFIKRNRQELDDYIKPAIGQGAGRIKLNDEDRRQWILNDEALYRWALSAGVKGI